MNNPTERFSDRVENYRKYRPGYPAVIIPFLKERCNLLQQSSAADIASGTGIFTALLLEHFNPVYAVEPNASMRKAAEQEYGGCPAFHSSGGTAEQTGLPEDAVDLITVAQAIHWFDLKQTAAEFRRILKPGGWVAIIRNLRLKEEGFPKAYEKLLQEKVPEYSKVNHYRITTKDLQDFLPRNFLEEGFHHQQRFNFQGLWGRLQSSSYAPAPESSEGQALKTALEELFQEYKKEGTVAFPYRCDVAAGCFL